MLQKIIIKVLEAKRNKKIRGDYLTYRGVQEALKDQNNTPSKHNCLKSTFSSLFRLLSFVPSHFSDHQYICLFPSQLEEVDSNPIGYKPRYISFSIPSL